MKRAMAIFYWVLIFFLQIYLLREKLQADGFFLWNAVALAASAIFLFFRLIKNRVLVKHEVTIAFFIGINGITTALGQILAYSNFYTLIVGIAVAVLSFVVAFSEWKREAVKSGKP